MTIRFRWIFLRSWLAALALLLLSQPGTLASGPSGPDKIHLPLVLGSPSPVSVPRLKWAYAGCFSSWCETGWYASPAVADLDGDEQAEVIAGAYSLFILDGRTGSLKRQVTTPGGRIWPGVVVADLEGDRDLEIVIAQGGGFVSVYDHQGNLAPGWPQRPAVNELRSLAVGDLDADGDMEIVVGQARLDPKNIWVFEHSGQLRPGWPQITTTQGSAAGLYNDNLGLGDLDGDGRLEVLVPSDTITIAAYSRGGQALTTNSLYHGQPGHDMDFWAEVPAYVDLAYESRGWGPCYQQFTPRANFANGPANVVDIDNDGLMEVLVIGDVHNCNTSPYTDLYNGPYLLRPDRSRFQTASFDWRTPPTDLGAPLSQDYNRIENAQPNPVTADLDGDGRLEILYPSYDGRVHAVWLDKSEHYAWPYAVNQPGEGFLRFASEPVVADLNADGSPEVMFASWVEKGTYRAGRLHVLNNLGETLHEIDLPPAKGSPSWNGALAAPTLANIDADPDLEVVLNTAHSGIVAYDLPNTANAQLVWATGRGDYLRDGSP